MHPRLVAVGGARQEVGFALDDRNAAAAGELCQLQRHIASVDAAPDDGMSKLGRSRGNPDHQTAADFRLLKLRISLLSSEMPER